MTNLERLKPCPFCGGIAKRWYSTPDGRYASQFPTKLWGIFTSHYKVECYKCGMRTKVYATERGAINAWNRRVDHGNKS